MGYFPLEWLGIAMGYKGIVQDYKLKQTLTAPFDFVFVNPVTGVRIHFRRHLLPKSVIMGQFSVSSQTQDSATTLPCSAMCSADTCLSTVPRHARKLYRRITFVIFNPAWTRF